MISKIVNLWRSSTRNEKMMYALLVISIIGISTRWRYVVTDIADAFTTLFTR